MLKPRIHPRLLNNAIKHSHKYTTATPSTPTSSFEEPFDLTTLSESSLNSTLLSLTTSGQFSAAERLRLKIISNGLFIYPRVEYSNAALACLRNRRLTGGAGLKLDEYVTWLELIPHREAVFPSALRGAHNTGDVISRDKSSPFSAIVDDLTYRALIPPFLPFVSCTNHILASKGYTSYHFPTLARPLILNASTPTSPPIHSLLNMEARASHYEDSQNLPSTPIARYIRSSLIQLFVQRGWVFKSVELILSERRYGLSDRVYQSVIEGLSGMSPGGGGGSKKKAMILKRWEKDKEENLYKAAYRLPDTMLCD